MWHGLDPTWYSFNMFNLNLSNVSLVGNVSVSDVYDDILINLTVDADSDSFTNFAYAFRWARKRLKAN